MALVKNQVGFPFVKGINTKSSDKAQAAGELRDCVNFTVNKVGRLDQRLGFRRYPRDVPALGSASSSTIESAKAMAHLGDEILLLDGENAYAKAADDQWVDRGPLLNIRNSSVPVNKDMQSTSGNAAYGVSGDFEYIAWAQQPFDTGGFLLQKGTGSNPVYRYMVRDKETGGTIVPVTTLQTMGITYVYTDDVSKGEWPYSGDLDKIGFTGGDPEVEIAKGDYIEVVDRDISHTDSSGVTTDGSNTISVTDVVGVNPLSVDMGVSGSGIVPGSVITSIDIPANEFDISNDATLTDTGVTLTFEVAGEPTTQKALVTAVHASTSHTDSSGVTNTGSNTISVTDVEGATPLSVDMIVSGSGIVTGSVITSIDVGANEFDISNDATLTDTGVTLTFVAPAYADLATELSSSSTFGGETVTIWKGTGQDAAYMAPRLRVLCPVGTPHVFVLLQDGLDIKYYYANTTAGTSTDLELTSKGTLLTMGRPFPAWDSDWILSDTATDPDNAAVIVAHYDSAYPYASSDLNVTISRYEIDDSPLGDLITPSTTDYPTDPARGDLGIATVRRPMVDVASPSANTTSWQLALKVIHDESIHGIPDVSDQSTIFLAFTSTGNKTSGSDAYTALFLFDHELDNEWDAPLYTEALTGFDQDWVLMRAGVGYDSTYIYVMGELHDPLNGGDYPSATQPQDSRIVSAKFKITNGDASLSYQVLWSGVSVHSDGFVPFGSDKGRFYFWLSACQLQSSRNSMTFLADMSGHIHAHCVQGYAAINLGLEHAQMAGNYTTVQRNMGCMATRVTPLRWTGSTTTQTQYVAGSSLVDIGAKFYEFNFIQPSLLKWNTDPQRPLRSQEANGLLYIGGGMLWAYDGNRLVENDFLLYPEIKSVSSGPEVGAVPVGDYSYYVTYEYRDDNGTIHVSRPAGPIPVALGDISYVEIKIVLNQLTNYRFTGKDGNPPNYTINIYRTNTDDTRHFLHSSLTASDWGDNFSPTLVTATYTDTDATQHTDADTDVMIWDAISTSFAGSPVSSPIDVTRHKDSILVSNTENVLYSSLGLSPVVAAIFPQIVAENTSHFGMFGDGTDSPITHVASNGMSCVFFTRDNGFAFSGEGPNMFGDGQWTRPEKFAPGQGVRPDGFIASTPMGVLYSSQNGIYLVSRDLQMANVGSPIDNYAVCPAANDPIVLDKSNEVIIPLWGGGLGAYPANVDRTLLVFNYFIRQWYRHEIGASVGDKFHVGHNVELMSWVNENSETVVYNVDSDGYLYRQKTRTDSDPYIDRIGASGTTYTVESSLVTSWLQLPGYGKKARCYRIALLGTYGAGPSGGGDSTLNLYTSTNFNNTEWNQEFTTDILPEEIGEDNSDNGSQVVVKPANQKMESIRVRLTLTTSSSGHNVLGWSPEGLLFEVGQPPIPTRFKVNSINTVKAVP